MGKKLFNSLDESRSETFSINTKTKLKYASNITTNLLEILLKFFPTDVNNLVDGVPLQVVHKMLHFVSIRTR